MGIWDILSGDSQQRAAALADLDASIGENLSYYLGPSGLPQRVGALSNVTPSAGMNRAGEASMRMAAPGMTPGQRIGAAGEMLSETAAFAAPLALGARGFQPMFEAVQDATMGFNVGARAIGEGMAARANQPGQMPVVGSNFGNVGGGRPPVTFDDVQRAMQENPLAVPRADEAFAAPQTPSQTPQAQPQAQGALQPPPPAAEDLAPPAPATATAVAAPAATAPSAPAQAQPIRLSPIERAAIKEGAPRGQVKQVQQQVATQKAQYAPEDGWAPKVMQVASVTPKKGKIEVKYKEVPYNFEKPPMGVEKDQWQQMMTSRAVDEVRQVADRVRAGDPAAIAIVKQANWYRGMRSSLRREFGGMGDVFADVLGTTSAQTGVEMNWNNAIEIMRRFSRGEFDQEIKMYEEKLAKGEADPADLQKLHKDEDSPFRLITNAAGALFNANSPAATRALLDMFRVAGGSPKTPNFTGNLIGYTNAATVDVWAARFLRRLSGKDRLPPPVEKGVTGKHLAGSTLEKPNVGGEFGFGQRVLEDAAREVNQQGIIKSVAPELSDMNPDDLQAVAWFIEKEKWAKNGWTTKAGEGGSFEFESSLAGAADPTRVKELRRRITASFKAPKQRKKETDEQYAARVENAQAEWDAGAQEAQKALDEAKAPLARYVLGISVERPNARPTNVQQAEVAGRLGEPAMSDTSVVAYQINNTYGRFMKEDERAFNAEFVVRENFDPTAITRRMVEVAKEADQDAAFISRVMPERTETSRPGVEIYFSNRQGPEFAQRLSDKLSEKGVDGFTYITDNRVMDQPARQAARNEEAVAGINGLRFQYIPEFEMGAEAWQAMSPAERAAKIDEVEAIFDDIVDDLSETEEGISVANLMHYETDVYTREQYDGLLGAQTSANDQ